MRNPRARAPDAAASAINMITEASPKSSLDRQQGQVRETRLPRSLLISVPNEPPQENTSDQRPATSDYQRCHTFHHNQSRRPVTQDFFSAHSAIGPETTAATSFPLRPAGRRHEPLQRAQRQEDGALPDAWFCAAPTTLRVLPSFLQHPAVRRTNFEH